MTSANHGQLEELFSQVLEKPTPAEQAAFLDGACGGDTALRTRVEELLHAHQGAGEFLDSPIIDPEATVASDSAVEEQGRRIGNYKILQEIGEGGFGVVYMAEQVEPVRRKVALKIIKLGMDTKQVIARFEAERQALALMDHPNIAKVLDAGATEKGRPYFVMELVRGIAITKYCDKNKLAARERLDLFLQVCQAVQHAHQKGIIHRDIKPSNVLVTLHDSRPVPKVIDFGIAKATSQRLTDKTLFTEFRQFIGTPEYMSPDQAETSGLDVDTRTDIYSLGVVLYELLTGTTPLDAKTLRRADFDEIKRIICEVEPPRPSTRLQALFASAADTASLRQTEPGALGRLIRGDLDWIVMKAIEKDRTRRYQTASELAVDIERHLNQEPVLAGPPGVTYKFSKFILRNRAAVLAGVLIGGVLLIGTALATVGYVQATRAKVALEEQRARAEDAAREAREEAAEATAVSDFLQVMLASVDPSRALGRGGAVRYVLDEAARKIDEGALAAQPEAKADVHMTLGMTYEALGLYDDAELHLRRAEATLVDVLGDEHAATLRARSFLAGVLTSQYEYAQAKARARQTAQVQERVLGPEHADTLLTKGRLGVALDRQEKYAEAEEIHRRTLETQRRVLGNEHPGTLRSQVNLGTVFLGQGRYAEAEALLRQALETEQHVLGYEHPETLRAMNSLALALERQEKYEAAETLYQRTWEMDRRVLGPDHPRTQIPLNNLLRVLRVQGKVAETRPLVAVRMERLKRLAEASDADAMASYAYAWELLTCEPDDLRDPAAALPAARRAVELDGGNDVHMLETLALALELTDDLDEAIKTQQRAVARAQAGGLFNYTELEQRLVELELKKGNIFAAARASWGGITNRLAESLADDVIPGGALILRAEQRLKEEKFAEAENLLRACLDTRQKKLPEVHWAVADVRSLLGEAVAGQRKFDEAEPLLLDGYAGMVKDKRAPEDRRRAARRRIVGFYESWGKPQQANRWRQDGEADGTATTDKPGG